MGKKKRTKGTAPVAEETAQKEVRSWVVNCSKCGAALNLKDGNQAYVCPVCGTLLKVKSGVRFVKDVSKEEKVLHVTITERAMQFMQERAAKRNKRCIFRRRRKNKPLLEDALLKAVKKGYTPQDNLIVDVNDKGLTVTKA